MKLPWVRRRSAVAALAVTLCNWKSPHHCFPPRTVWSDLYCCGECLAQAQQRVDLFARQGTRF